MRTAIMSLLLTILSFNAFAQQQVPAVENGRRTRQSASKDNSVPQGEVSFPPKLSVGNDTSAPLNAKQKKAVKLSKARLNDRLQPTKSSDGTVSYVYGHMEPAIVCTPGKWCAIKLEPNEIISGGPESIMLTDYENWWAKPMAYGSKGNMLTEVMVSPKYPDIDAQIAFGTNFGRRYVVDLRARKRDYVHAISFTYPDDEVKRAEAAYKKKVQAQQQSASGGADIASLDSAFSIDGDADFRPLSVYTDGKQTVIDFGHELRELPVLVGIANDGGIFSDPTRYVLNTSLIGNRKMLVDGTFDRAALVGGVGGEQEEVMIARAKRS